MSGKKKPTNRRPVKGSRKSSSARSQRRYETTYERSLGRVIFDWVGTAFALFFIVAALIFCWNRWWRYDDAADLIGEWEMLGGGGAITITADEIMFANSDDPWQYQVDSGAKIINFNLTSSAGQATYRFSEDRTQVFFLDSTDTGMDTLISDLQWTFDCMRATLAGTGPYGIDAPEGAIVMVRVS